MINSITPERLVWLDFLLSAKSLRQPFVFGMPVAAAVSAAGAAEDTMTQLGQKEQRKQRGGLVC